eukprot:5434224-Prymnesium_polylepis.4
MYMDGFGVLRIADDGVSDATRRTVASLPAGPHRLTARAAVTSSQLLESWSCVLLLDLWYVVCVDLLSHACLNTNWVVMGGRTWHGRCIY